MAEVWFIRHGQSIANAGEVTTDTGSAPLTQKGRQQADARAATLPEDLDLIIHTPYIRTEQTAEPARRRFPDVPCEVWPLQEFSTFSKTHYNGTTRTQREPLAEAFWARRDPDYAETPGDETFRQFVERIRDSLEKLQERPEKKIAVFAHGRVMQTLHFMLEKPDATVDEVLEAMATRRPTIQNCDVMRLTADEQGVRYHPEPAPPFRGRFHVQGVGFIPCEDNKVAADYPPKKGLQLGWMRAATQTGQAGDAANKEPPKKANTPKPPAP
ncbi:MAG: histidine phosphatase family protein [Alphaproteobacteria bacterium]|nr:histidine phosphatase family protein [Alphaproteobacteria bacterium]